jgi:hypothetical protein
LENSSDYMFFIMRRDDNRNIWLIICFLGMYSNRFVGME